MAERRPEMKIRCVVSVLLILFLTVMLLCCACAQAESGTVLSASDGRAMRADVPPLPGYTQTDCVWDDAGNLISEIAHDLNGVPAVNSRGFYRAEYVWDEHANLLSEAYFGLNGEPVVVDTGYARAEYTYYTNANGDS